MKKTTYENWVASFVQRLLGYLDLSGWAITLQHAKEPEDSDCGCVYAKIFVDCDYQKATMTVFPVGRLDFDKGDMERLVEAILHEMVHILLNPFADHLEPHLSQMTRPFFVKTLEQQTQRLTTIFLKTLPKELIPPR